MAVRLHTVLPEFKQRVTLRIRPYPLEVFGSGPAPRDILEQEWWLASLQEPAASFAPFDGDDWPSTTLPAFEAVWSARQQDEALAIDYDLRIRRAFFAESCNIGRKDVLLELARDVGLEVPALSRALENGLARDAVLEEGHLARERYGVRGTPTVMLPDGTRLSLPIAFPKMRRRKIVSVETLPCCGNTCIDATRNLFLHAFERQQAR